MYTACAHMACACPHACRYEAQLAGADKQYLLLQRQWDAGANAADKLGEVSAALRKERDTLWAEAQVRPGSHGSAWPP